MSADNRLQGGQATALGRRKIRTRAIVVGFFVFVAMVVVLESPLTRIRTLAVSGNTSIPARQLLQDATLKKGMSLWQVNRAVIARAVTAREPVVSAVAVHTDFWTGTVTLAVRENRVVAVLDHDNRFYQLLSNGVVFAPFSSRSGFSWPIVSDTGLTGAVTVGKPTASAAIAVLCGQLSHLSGAQLAPVSQVDVDQFQRAILYLTDGFAVRLTLQDVASGLSSALSAVQYFTSHGYAPGLIDLAAGPPYEYTPFASERQQASKGGGGG